MNTFYEDVGEFHQKFKLPLAKIKGGERRCQLLGVHDYSYRSDFLREELAEFHESWAKADLAGCADALVDLVWVALGTAHYMGLPFDALWAEVKRANMAKVLRTDGDVTHKRGAVETIRKPEGWEPPDVEGILKILVDQETRDLYPEQE